MQSELEDLLERWPLAKVLNLQPESNVLVIGAYKGVTMELLDEMYHPASIVGYEPQIWAADIAKERLKDRPNCEVIEYALGRYYTSETMGEWFTDACSFINNGPNSREQHRAHMWNADETLKHQYKDRNIDFCLINIEGYEFVLLPFLREKGWFSRIDRIAVQFHLGLGNDGNYLDVLNDFDQVYEFVKDDDWELPSWGYWRKPGC